MNAEPSSSISRANSEAVKSRGITQTRVLRPKRHINSHVVSGGGWDLITDLDRALDQALWFCPYVTHLAQGK